MPRVRPGSAMLKARMRALANVSAGLGTIGRRFIRDVCRNPTMIVAKMSDRQAMMVERLAWTYRRQMPDRLVPPLNPGPMPPKPARVRKPAHAPPAADPEDARVADLFREPGK